MKKKHLATRTIQDNRQDLGGAQNLYYRKALIRQTSVRKGLVYVMISLVGQQKIMAKEMFSMGYLYLIL